MLQDPRRLDPRRVTVPVNVPATSGVEDNVSSAQCPAVQSDFDATSPHISLPISPSVPESTSQLLMPTTQTDLSRSESPLISEVDEAIHQHEVQDVGPNVLVPDREANNSVHLSPSPINKVEDTVAQESVDVIMLDEAYSPSLEEADQLSPDTLYGEASEVSSAELPLLPPYIELAEDHQRNAIRLALERIINEYQNSQGTNFEQTQIAMVARLFAQAGLKIPLINLLLGDFTISISSCVGS